MEFDITASLRKATSRAKSDVANKLVGMLLHEVSRRATKGIGMQVKDETYINTVREVFGSGCAYCRRPLERQRVAVEHLDGMNRFRLGLHIPGNVAIACADCNREKRRDDQHEKATLAETGWESFLSHDSHRCEAGCRTCEYWRTLFPDDTKRTAHLMASLKRIRTFRAKYPAALEWNAKIRPLLAERITTLYREGQKFAANQINTAIEQVMKRVA